VTGEDDSVNRVMIKSATSDSIPSTTTAIDSMSREDDIAEFTGAIIKNATPPNTIIVIKKPPIKKGALRELINSPIGSSMAALIIIMPPNTINRRSAQNLLDNAGFVIMGISSSGLMLWDCSIYTL